MTYYIDVSAAVHAKAGLSRYAGNLAQALLRSVPERCAFFFNQSGDSDIPSWLLGQKTRRIRAGYKPWRMLVWLAQMMHLGFDPMLPDCELFHATEHLLLPLRRCPTVLTVHDLIFHLFPERHKRLNRWYLNAALPIYCRRADAIICVSNNSKADLVRSWGIPPSKIHVVYEAAEAHFKPVSPDKVEAVRRQYGLPSHYLVTVGTIEPRKNLSRLLDVLTLLRQQGKDASLVIVGRTGWLYRDFLEKLDDFECRDAVLLTGYVPDHDLPAVYAGAKMMVLASMYEGFGLPILESMACGAPVVSSHASSLPEVGGDAVRYFDPYDVDDMLTVIKEVWCDAELRHQMRDDGLVRATQFSWDRAAQETLNIYRNFSNRKMEDEVIG